MTLCTSSIEAVGEAVARLALSEPPTSDEDASSSIAAALRDLYSGHLVVEAPDRVDATISALMPALCDETLANHLDWAVIFPPEVDSSSEADGSEARGTPAIFDEDSAAKRTVAFLADRVARSLGADLDLGGSGYEGSANDVFVGILGEATQSIQAVSTVLKHGLRATRPRLGDPVLADLVYACERIIASTAGADIAARQEKSSSVSTAVATVQHGAHTCAVGLLERLPLYGKRTPSLPALVARVWSSESSRDGLHRHIMASLRIESKLPDCDGPLGRLALTSAVCVSRSLLFRFSKEDTERHDSVLPFVLAEALPVTGEVSRPRRIEAVSIVSRCLACCSPEALSAHSGAIVAALTDALLQGDVETALATYPALAAAMRLVYPVQSMVGTPPAVWTDALEELVGQFGRFANESGDDSDACIAAAAVLAEHLAATGQLRLVLHLSGLVAAFEVLLRKAGLLAARTGAASLGTYQSVCRALVSMMRYTWPRIPSHMGGIIRGCFVSVLSAREVGRTDESCMGCIVEAAADVVACAGACGPRAEFVEILDGLRPVLARYDSLRVGRELEEASRRRGAGGGGDEAQWAEARTGGGVIVGKFFGGRGGR